MCSATCVGMTTMGSWFWVMSSCFWHAVGAARREGEAKGCATQAQPPWIGCPHAPSRPWSMVQVADTIQLEHLVWVVFDNIMGLGEAPPLPGLETYAQIIECLAGKAYRGQHVCCPAQTSASFGTEAMARPTPGGPELKKPGRPQCYSMTRDVRKEFVGSYSALKEKQDLAGGRPIVSTISSSRPNIQGMKWMKECQHSYRDVQLNFWLLLQPLTDSSEELTRQLAHRLLSMWHWSSAIDPPPPHICLCPHQ